MNPFVIPEGITVPVLDARIAAARALLEALMSELGCDEEQHPLVPVLARVIDALDGEP